MTKWLGSMGLDMSTDSITLSRIPYRHGRVGSIQYVVILAGCLGVLAVLLLVSGAILSAIVYTEVRPPTADENYHRYIGSDIRRVVGPVMMLLAGFMICVGCAVVLLGFRSAQKDRNYLDDTQETEMESLKKRAP